MAHEMVSNKLFVEPFLNKSFISFNPRNRVEAIKVKAYTDNGTQRALFTTLVQAPLWVSGREY